MIFQHAGAALRGRFFKFLACGVIPDINIITRVKFQVDQSKGLEDTAYGCLKSGALKSAFHDRRPYNSVTHYRDTLWPVHGLTATVLPFLAANELLNCFITRGPTTCLCTWAVSILATPLLLLLLLLPLLQYCYLRRRRRLCFYFGLCLSVRRITNKVVRRITNRVVNGFLRNFLEGYGMAQGLMG